MSLWILTNRWFLALWMRWFSLRSDGVSCHISQNHTSWRQLLDPIAICPPLCSQGCWQMLGISITMDLQMLSIQEEHRASLGSTESSLWIDWVYVYMGRLFDGLWFPLNGMRLSISWCRHEVFLLWPWQSFFWNERLVGEIFCLIQSRYCWWKKSQTTTWDG